MGKRENRPPASEMKEKCFLLLTRSECWCENVLMLMLLLITNTTADVNIVCSFQFQFFLSRNFSSLLRMCAVASMCHSRMEIRWSAVGRETSYFPLNYFPFQATFHFEFFMKSFLFIAFEKLLKNSRESWKNCTKRTHTTKRNVLRSKFLRFEKQERQHRKRKSSQTKETAVFSVQKQILNYGRKSWRKNQESRIQRKRSACFIHVQARNLFVWVCVRELCVKIHIIKIEIFSSTSSLLFVLVENLVEKLFDWKWSALRFTSHGSEMSFKTFSSMSFGESSKALGANAHVWLCKVFRLLRLKFSWLQNQKFVGRKVF